jgi:putative lipoic acid-binding regulatory protein
MSADAGAPARDSLIQYPSAFPIKVMGGPCRRLHRGHRRGGAPVRPGFRRRDGEKRPSKGGNYLGLTITVTATSREQLDELYRTLSTHPMVKVVLYPLIDLKRLGIYVKEHVFRSSRR